MVVDERQVIHAIRAVLSRSDNAGNAPTARVRKKKKKNTSDTSGSDTSDSDTSGSDTSDSDTSERDGAAARDSRQHDMNEWIADYTEMASACARPLTPLSTRLDGLSVSHVFAIAAKQYAAAVIANIRYHFRAYVCACLGLVMRSHVCGLLGVGNFDKLPPAVRKRWRKAFGKAYDDVLFHRTGDDMKAPEELRSTIERHRHRMVPSLPPRVRTIDCDLDSKHRPFVYLGYMLRMTAFLEATGTRRLLSPVPLKTSFIPAHYHFDTTAIAHLLMDGKRIEGFAQYFPKSVSGGFPLPGLKDKASLCASLQKLCGRSTAPTAGEEELFKDALWTYLADFRNRRTRLLNPLCHKRATESGRMRFDHSISTDGYSVTLIVSDREIRGRKHIFKSAVSGRKRKNPPKEGLRGGEFPVLTADTVDKVSAHLRNIVGDKEVENVGGDPGKGNLLSLVGASGATLRYTGAQRRHDTLGALRARTLARVRKRSWNGGDVTLPAVAGASQPMRKRSAERLERFMAQNAQSPKTCDISRLRLYVAFREETRNVMEAAYHRRVVRAMRFLAWSRRDASVRRFAQKILETFGRGGTAQVVILYGDWGRNPNLKHQAPSPGIGLRRLLHETPGITTVTVREAYTSSFCPNCHDAVYNARGAHGLLKCDNSRLCGTWWARDILGAKNILDKGMFLMENRCPHPRFGN
jgi:hypothetical protein